MMKRTYGCEEALTQELLTHYPEALQVSKSNITRKLFTKLGEETEPGFYAIAVSDFSEDYSREIMTKIIRKTVAIKPLIRCKDCKYNDERQRNTATMWLPCMNMETDNNWFCGSAERKDQCGQS